MTESSEDSNGDTVDLWSLLDQHSVDPDSSLPEDVQLSIAVARHLQTVSYTHLTLPTICSV